MLPQKEEATLIMEPTQGNAVMLNYFFEIKLHNQI